METARTVRAMKAARSDFESMVQLFKVGPQLGRNSCRGGRIYTMASACENCPEVDILGARLGTEP